MYILIITDLYPPEISSAAHLMQELAEGLKKRGHQIAVATSYPRHYLNTKTKKQIFNTISFENNIKVLRIKTLPLHKVSFIVRGFSQLLLPFIFLRKIKKIIKEKIDIVIVYSPPLTLGLAGEKIKKYYKAQFILNIQDIFPQNAIDLNILRNRLIIKLFEYLEKKVYKSADKITFHSEGGRRFLIDKKAMPAEKVIVLPNWIDLKPYQNLTKNISFREKYNLQDKFIFIFGGIMGPAQGLEFLVHIAQQVTDLKNIVFLLVGDGTEKEKIKNLIKKYKLNNIILKPFIPKEEYPYLVKDSDVGMVCLSTKNKTPFVPGKFLGYLAAKKPIVAFLNKESDGFEIIEKAQCGYAGRSDNLEKAIQIVRKIYNEKEKLTHFGQNGYNYALKNLTIKICLNKLEKLFNQ